MSENTEMTIISSSAAIEAINRSEVDALVATAKAYPRDLSSVINDVRTLATIDTETAGSCFYSLRREGKCIEGPSVRLSEIIRASYGNISVASRIISNDGKFITAQGVCIDYEKNNRCSSEVKVRITTKDGRTYSDDMQTIAGNAACAKAERNAVFKVVPMAIFKSILDEVKQVSLGNAASLAETRTKMIDWYAKAGISQQMLLEYLNVNKVEEIDSDMVIHLRGLSTALRDGSTTIEETFINPAKEKKDSEAATKKVAQAAEMAKAATAKATKAAAEKAAEEEKRQQELDKQAAELFGE